MLKELNDFDFIFANLFIPAEKIGEIVFIDNENYLVFLFVKCLDCVCCGACIVQCPVDALWFQNAAGQIVTPDTVRRYKLNLMGKRAVQG